MMKLKLVICSIIIFGISTYGQDNVECDEYKEIAKSEGCGTKELNNTFTGVLQADPKEFPHTALLGFIYPEGDGKVEWLCGGSLISDQFVLTAAHCANSRLHGPPKVVRLGEFDLTREDDDARPEDYAVSEFIVHPNFIKTSKYNDIGLLKLDRKVEFSPYKKPACLPTKFDYPNTFGTIPGWGSTTFGGSSSNQLLKVRMEIFPHEECSAIYGSEISRILKDGILRESHLCAGSRTSTGDACQGFGGSPLQINHPDGNCAYTILALSSFGKGCGNIGVPSVYTRVFPYLDWIESIVWKTGQ